MAAYRGAPTLLVALVLIAVSAMAQPADGPKVQLGYPPADLRTDKDVIPVIGLIADEHGVKSVELVVNGQPVALGAPPDPAKPPPSFPVTAKAPLLMGRNQISLTVTSGAGKTTQVTRSVTRVPPAPVASPPPAAPPVPAKKPAERYAVIVGAGTYEQSTLPAAPVAERDAQALYDLLVTKGGYKTENVQFLTGPKATLRAVNQALGVWLYRRASKDDSVLVYFAGRGAPEVDPTGRERDGLAKYLLTGDTDPESLFSTAFPLTKLEDVFQRLRSDRVVFLLDADFTGNMTGRSYSRQSTRAASVSAAFLERLASATGRVFITASGANESAIEAADVRHGLFTYYLLQGLGGAADRDADGIVTLNELYGFMQGKVAEHAKKLGTRQTPVMQGALTDLPLVEVPKR
ncbi:MAG: caspase family protein [Candidatus Rokubacteria bacterium]|nr:caspase family protein [Candidatus Rokubacteria bacterium]